MSPFTVSAGRLSLVALLLVGSSCTSTRAKDRVATFPAIGDPDRGPALADRVGMAQQFVWGSDDASRVARAGQLTRLASIGVRLERINFTWHKLEPKPGEFDFAALDAVVDDATRAGVRLIGVACYGNPAYPQIRGAGPGTALPLDDPSEVFFPPKDPADYARFVAAITARYKDRVQDYELWNEQNLGYRFFRPDASPSHYAAMAKQAAQAGHRECPSCRYVVGGLSMPQPVPRIELYKIGPDYLRSVYAAAPDLNSFVDGVAFHPYQYPKDAPEVETAAFEDRFQGSLETQTRTLEGIVRSAGGPQVPLWITENGWPTNPGIPSSDEEIARIFGADVMLIRLGRAVLGDEDFAKVVESLRGVPEATQAHYLVRSVLLAAKAGLPVIVLYGLEDYPQDPLINQESVFGVFRLDGSEKPAAGALRTLMKRFGSLRVVGDVTAQLGLDAAEERAVALRDGDRVVVALWRWKEGERTMRIDDIPGNTEVVAEDGTVVARGARGASVDLTLSASVVYVDAAVGR